jgi:raffinose/stachyose/melibiose transport system permease protein/N-acetylglucosamine transport system permease protein
MFALFAVYVITLIYPFAWLFMNSWRDVRAFGQNPNAFPSALTLRNYIDAFTVKTANDTSLIGMFANSLLIATGGTLLTVVTSSCTAYIISKFQFRGRGLIFSIVVFSMILPVVGTLPALLRVMKSIGLYNNYLALLFLYSGGMGNNFILLYSFFKNISWQYAEAGYMDGASEFRVFLQIMMPLALPAVTSIAVLTWIGLWNEYVMPRVLLPSRPTIAVGLFEITTKYEGVNRPLLFSAVIVSLLPIIAVFIAFQKTIMTNTVAGGLKG